LLQREGGYPAEAPCPVREGNLRRNTLEPEELLRRGVEGATGDGNAGLLVVKLDHNRSPGSPLSNTELHSDAQRKAPISFERVIGELEGLPESKARTRLA